MDEFELIRSFWAPLGDVSGAPGIQLGIGDDCAVLDVPQGMELVQSVDTLVESVHFLPEIAPRDLGWRALAVNLSDLAAAGAQPWCFSLAISLPDLDPQWLREFSGGLAELAAQYAIPLVGGDTTRGPCVISIIVQGLVPKGTALRRKGARPGDRIFVSGTLGDAGGALDWLQVEKPPADVGFLLDRYHRPTPRIALGQWLRGRASACIDISDGLSADLGHILASSGVGANLDSRSIPLSPTLRDTVGSDALSLALTAGDDYELCFTWPADQAMPEDMRERFGVDVAPVGEVVAGSGLSVDGKEWAAQGYDHFKRQK
ncbi:thiamine-phosphate kinase [Marinobacteraceae bacterium S3BR75-40.1]